MTRHAAVASVQRAGIEAMSSLVGNRWDGLQTFMEVGGVQRIENALRNHADDVTIQTKGIRALASGAEWPKEARDRCHYSAPTAVELTKTGMMRHISSAELQQAGLEALARYIDKLRCLEEVQAEGGAG